MLRGRLHQVAFFASIPAGVVLLLFAPGPLAVVGALIYWIALLGQFGTSAAYHVGSWGEEGRARMKTLDHATIFILIAGSYTAFCSIVLEGTQAVAVRNTRGFLTNPASAMSPAQVEALRGVR